jgi:hypothetical protein
MLTIACGLFLTKIAHAKNIMLPKVNNIMLYGYNSINKEFISWATITMIAPSH